MLHVLSQFKYQDNNNLQQRFFFSNQGGAFLSRAFNRQKIDTFEVIYIFFTTLPKCLIKVKNKNKIKIKHTYWITSVCCLQIVHKAGWFATGQKINK